MEQVFKFNYFKLNESSSNTNQNQITQYVTQISKKTGGLFTIYKKQLFKLIEEVLKLPNPQKKVHYNSILKFSDKIELKSIENKLKENSILKKLSKLNENVEETDNKNLEKTEGIIENFFKKNIPYLANILFNNKLLITSLASVLLAAGISHFFYVVTFLIFLVGLAILCETEQKIVRPQNNQEEEYRNKVMRETYTTIKDNINSIQPSKNTTQITKWEEIVNSKELSKPKQPTKWEDLKKEQPRKKEPIKWEDIRKNLK